MEFTDAQLIESARAGVPSAFDALVRRYAKLVYSVAYFYVKDAEDAEDIVQDVCVNAMRAISRFDTSRPFKPWLLQIARNRALDWLKAKRPIAFSQLQQEDDTNWVETLPDPSPSTDRIVADRMEAERVAAAVRTLPDPYRLVVSLRYLKQLTFREIGEELGELLDTVKTRHRRALGMLKQRLAEPVFPSTKRD